MLNPLNVWKDKFLPWDYANNWWENIKMFFKCIKWSYQRVTRGYADVDVWSLDYFYSKIISETLNYLADNHVGVPISFEDGTEKVPDKWAIWLHETAHFFEEADRLEDTINMVNYKRIEKEIYELRSEGLRRIGSYWRNLWD